jgi:hypothetical protein
VQQNEIHHQKEVFIEEIHFLSGVFKAERKHRKHKIEHSKHQQNQEVFFISDTLT